jgi:type VI secretion system protein ImpG
MIEKYFEEELRYLYESGKEFAKAHPQRAQYLNIDAVGDRDPYVERLFEGFAFLAARIREKLDDSFPELTENLINLLWPDFLQEIPSLTIVQFKPRQNFLQETRVLPRGTELLSNAAGPESVICRFATTQEIRFNPVNLVSVEKKVDTRRKSSLSFNFALETGADLRKLKLSPLRLYLHAEQPTALMLLEFLTRHTAAVEIGFDNGRVVQSIPCDGAVRGGGLTIEESLLPNQAASFWGHAMLREYFVFPEKFLFVDLHGFEQVAIGEPLPKTISYTISFDREFPADKPFSTENFRMFCSPAINLFKRNTEPLTHSAFNAEYRVVGDVSYPLSYTTHSIVSVQGIDRASGERNPYKPLYSFETKGKMMGRTYTTNYRVAPDGRRHMYITLGGEQLSGEQFREEGVSIEAWCTNGIIPREEIREGGLNKPGNGFPDYLTFTNITRPTLPYAPPPQGEYQWIFISQLSATYTSLGTPDTLRAAMQLFDWSGAEGQRRKLEAISEVGIRPARSMIGGSTICGVEFTVGVTETGFLDSGDINLFGEVLRTYLSTYASLNSFVNLVLVLKPSGKEIRWDSKVGKRWPV